MSEQEKYYGIALNMIPRIGSISAKTLLSYCGSFENIFKAQRKALEKIPGIGDTVVDAIISFDDYDAVEKEIKYIEKNNIELQFYISPNFPARFLQFPDSPFILYKKGMANLNHIRTLGIVGTRKPTPYGIEWTRDLVESLQQDDISIISGYAYGIDIAAHKAAYKSGIPTICVLAGGLEMIYPSEHLKFVEDICETGAFISEHFSAMIPDKKRFPMRNRLIAGLSDGVVVVESASKGGSMITADIAFGYNKSVMAVPGSPNATYSRGCNALIKSSKAALVETREDILENMNWDVKRSQMQQQTALFRDLTPKETEMIDMLRQRKDMGVDELRLKLQMKSNEFASLLITLDLDGYICQLPGNRIMLL